LDPSASAPELSAVRLRDYVAAFVLAGLDRNVGAETEFFADRVQYYDEGMMDREKIRQDLKLYDERWPERHFWFAGTINLEPQSDNRVRVTFPLGFKMRNGNKTVTGKVDKTLVLEPAGTIFRLSRSMNAKPSRKVEVCRILCVYACFHGRRHYMETIASKDPRAHTANIRKEFRELIEYLRDDIEKINEPKAQALFETTAEVISGLDTAFKHYQAKTEDAW